MAYTIIWSEESLSNIEGIAEFISQDSAYYSQHVVATIFHAGESLSEQPTRGRQVPELNNPNIREIFVYSYRLLYELAKDSPEILILAVIHGRRLLEPVEDSGDSGLD